VEGYPEKNLWDAIQDFVFAGVEYTEKKSSADAHPEKKSCKSLSRKNLKIPCGSLSRNNPLPSLHSLWVKNPLLRAIQIKSLCGLSSKKI
jgi:hypothetical protein